jgi:transcriptional regulator with PAS, ATPase and Fis domain
VVVGPLAAPQDRRTHDDHRRPRRKCDLVIDHDSVSREHARVEIGDGGVTLRDLGSKNGTVVAGRRLRAREAVPLAHGVFVELGDAGLVYHRRYPPFASAPPPSMRAPHSYPEGFFIATDGPMAGAHSLVESFAPNVRLPILILGETGTGKEVIARSIHRLSHRSGPFMPVNCGQIPASLADSVLFGHEKGAFTSADVAKAGLVEAAHKGTLFLDELGEMPLDTQVKLLRVLDDREIVRVGATTAQKVDVLMVAATNRDLEASVRAGTFRADLFFRLSGGTIRLPPLRERPRDIVALARMFLERHCAAQKRAPMGISTGAERALARHAWPGNVRELMYAIERAAALAAKGGVIEVEHLARESAGAMPAAAVVATEEDATGDPERARI